MKGSKMIKYLWIPESPTIGGVYANDTDFSESGKIRVGIKQPSTTSVNDALKFESEDECKAWCDNNQSPVFVPRQHGFVD